MNGWALFGIIAIYLLICVGIGMLRGLSRARVRTIAIFVSGILAFIGTLIAKNSLGTPQEIEASLRSYGLDEELMETIATFLGMSPSLGEALVGVIGALAMPIVYLVLFLAFCLLTWIVCIVLSIVLRKRYREHNSRARMKWLRTIALSVLHGLIVVFVFLVPLNVYMQIAVPVTDMLDESGMLDKVPAIDTIMDGYVEPIAKSGPMATFRVLGGNLVCNSITNFEVGGEKIKLGDEVNNISGFVGNILKLGKTKMAEYGDEQVQVLEDIADSFAASDLLSNIVGEVVYSATDAWIGGDKFVGVARPSTGEMIDPTFNTLLGVLHKDSQNLSSLKADIYTVADLVDVLAEYDVFSKMDDTDTLIQQLGADGMVKEMITVLGQNDSMKVLIVEIRNMGMRAIAKSLDIPENGEVVYEKFLGDIAVALNETKDMSETERIDALTQKVKDAFNEANVPIEEDIIDCYSASLIHDLGSIENITSDDISDFFTAYAMQTESAEEAGLVPVSGAESPFRGNVYGKMTEEDLKKTGAAVLATVTIKLSMVEGDEQAVIEASATILKETYSEILDENAAAFEKIAQIEIKVAIDKSAVENTASMKNAQTMNSGVVTLEELLADVEEVAKSINEETLAAEAEALNSVFEDMSKLLDSESFDSVEDVIGTLGPVLDSLQTSVSMGEEGTANLLVATMQSKTVRDKTNMDMNSATNLAKKATESKDGEKVDYEKTMNSVVGVVIIGNSISSGESASEEDIRKMIENLTPQTAALLSEYVTEARMKEYGMPADKAHVSSELLLNLFDYLASDLPEDQFDHEAKALQQLIDIATAAKEDTTHTNRVFGKDGKLGKDASEIIAIVIESDAICYSLDETLNSEDGSLTDPFGIGKQIPDNSVDKMEYEAAAEAYLAAHPDQETAERMALINALFGIN